jgi:hypothetical protein
MNATSKYVLVAVLAVLASACGGDDEKATPEPTLDILDPTEAHYGGTYEEWAAAWVQYVNDVAPPECINPILDTTGETCALYQDPESPVFLLVGNFGGISIREDCVVPAGKAIYLPLINSYGDNAGVPAEMTVSDAELKAYVEGNFELIDSDSLRLAIDGQELERLERGAIPSAPYTIDLEPGANVYECNAVEGVEGEFSGYVSGYWAMLAPLEPGAHTIEFGGASDAAPQGQPVTIDVRYELTVE